MNFISNRIVNPAGTKSASFEDWVQKFLKQANQDEPQPEVTAEAVEKTVEAKCGKEMGESSDAGKVTEKHTPAGPGNDENPEPKILINNDPNYQKPMKGEESNKSESKKSEPKSEKKEKSDKEASQKSGLVSKFEKIASLDRKSKLELFRALSANRNNPIEYVEAMVGLKVANMTPEEKKDFIAFWETMYPAEYVQEMAADR